MKDKLLSILIPVYNEQAYLARLVERVVAAQIPKGLRKEIIIVNDASTDGTQCVIDELMKRFPEIRAFRQPINCGKGAAIRRAISEMSGHFCVIQDADLEYDPNEYPIVLKPLLEANADAVYGSRFANREMRKVLFYHHKLGNLFLTHLSNWTTGLDLTDMETCYKAFRADLLKTIPLRSNRFGIEPEITAKIAKRNFSVYEVPISYHGRKYNEGKKIGWKDGISAIWTILKFWLIDDCYTEESAQDVLHRIVHARANTKHIVKKMSPYFGTEILELNSGIGNMSRHLPQKSGLTLTDPNASNANMLLRVYDGNAVVHVIQLNIESEQDVQAVLAENRRFDTIIVFQTLEYAESEQTVLRHAHSLLRDNGSIILIAPKNPKMYGARDAAIGIKKRYTEQELRTLFEQNGLHVTHIEGFHFLAFVGNALNIVFKRAAPLNKVQLKIYNTLVPIFGFLEKWLPLPGGDIFAVGEKR